MHRTRVARRGGVVGDGDRGGGLGSGTHAVRQRSHAKGDACEREACAERPHRVRPEEVRHHRPATGSAGHRLSPVPPSATSSRAIVSLRVSGAPRREAHERSMEDRAALSRPDAARSPRGHGDHRSARRTPARHGPGGVRKLVEGTSLCQSKRSCPAALNSPRMARITHVCCLGESVSVPSPGRNSSALSNGGTGVDVGDHRAILREAVAVLVSGRAESGSASLMRRVGGHHEDNNAPAQRGVATVTPLRPGGAARADAGGARVHPRVGAPGRRRRASSCCSRPSGSASRPRAARPRSGSRCPQATRRTVMSHCTNSSVTVQKRQDRACAGGGDSSSRRPCEERVSTFGAQRPIRTIPACLGRKTVLRTLQWEVSL